MSLNINEILQVAKSNPDMHQFADGILDPEHHYTESEEIARVNTYTTESQLSYELNNISNMSEPHKHVRMR